MIKQKHTGIGQTKRKKPKRKDKKQRPTFLYTKKSYKNWKPQYLPSQNPHNLIKRTKFPAWIREELNRSHP